MRIKLEYLLLLTALGCTEPTSPAVDCQGLLEVTITVTRFGTDTIVACMFPEIPLCDDDNEDHHHHRHHHHRS